MSAPHVEQVEMTGHIIDSLLLPKVLDEILTRGGSYDIKDIRVGQQQDDPSYARIEVPAPTPPSGSRRSSPPSTTTGPCPRDAERLRHRRGRHGRRVPRRVLQHHQLPHAGPARRRVDRRRGPGDGLRHPGRSRRGRRPLRADDRRADRRPDRRRPAGAARLPAGGRDAAARAVRVHGQPRVQREAQGRERARDRRGHAADPRGRREDPRRARPGGRPHRRRRAASRS